MNITITGDIGSGKSTVAKELAKRLSMSIVDTGQLYRKYAQDKGLNVLEQNKSEDWSIDHLIDEELIELGKMKDNQIFVSRLAWHFVRNAIRIYLVVNPMLAACRIAEDKTRNSESHTSIEETYNYNKSRKSLELDRYAKLYSLDDPSGLSHADIVIVVGKNSVEDVCDCIELALQNNDFGYYIDPKTLIPTQCIRDYNMGTINDYFEEVGYGTVKCLNIPICKSGELYYVKDGHHRVAACIRNGVKFIRTNNVTDQYCYTESRDIYDYEELVSISLQDELGVQEMQKTEVERLSNFKKFVKDYTYKTRGREGVGCAYEMPCGFYTISTTKYLKSIDGKISGVTGANIFFNKYEDTENEVIWKYMGEFPNYDTSEYFYLSECLDYDIHFVAKDISTDGVPIGFSKDEVTELLQECNADSNKKKMVIRVRHGEMS